MTKSLLKCWSGRINPSVIDVDLVNELQILEPFGAGNSQPVFALMGMRIDRIEGVSQNKHTKVTLSKNDTQLVAMRFGVSPESFDFSIGDFVDAAINLDRSEYMGMAKVSIIIRDMRFSKIDEDSIIESQMLYEKFRRKETLTEEERILLCPDREFIGKVFRLLRQGIWRKSEETLCVKAEEDVKRLCAVKVSLDVLEEMGLITRDLKNRTISIKMNKGKVDLTQSKILKSLAKG